MQLAPPNFGFYISFDSRQDSSFTTSHFSYILLPFLVDVESIKFTIKSQQIENPQFSDEIGFNKVCLTMWKLIKEPSVWTYIFVMCGQSYVFFQGLKLFPMFMSRQLNLDLASVGLLS